jgi:hypothetical protein
MKITILRSFAIPIAAIFTALAFMPAQKATAEAESRIRLIVGLKFSIEAASEIAKMLLEEGCQVEVTQDGGLPFHLTVEASDFSEWYNRPATAASVALEKCEEMRTNY